MSWSFLAYKLGDDYAEKRLDGLSGVRNILWSVGGGGASAVVGGIFTDDSS